MLEYATSKPLWPSTEPYNSGSRVDSRLVDISARTGYALVGAKRTDPHAQASEYYQVLIFKLTFFLLLTSWAVWPGCCSSSIGILPYRIIMGPVLLFYLKLEFMLLIGKQLYIWPWSRRVFTSWLDVFGSEGIQDVDTAGSSRIFISGTTTVEGYRTHGGALTRWCHSHISKWYYVICRLRTVYIQSWGASKWRRPISSTFAS